MSIVDKLEEISNRNEEAYIESKLRHYLSSELKRSIVLPIIEARGGAYLEWETIEEIIKETLEEVKSKRENPSEELIKTQRKRLIEFHEL